MLLPVAAGPGSLSPLGGRVACFEWNLREWFIFPVGSFFIVFPRKVIFFFFIIISTEFCSIRGSGEETKEAGP